MEEWRVVKGFEKYQVSSFGRVRSYVKYQTPRILKGTICRDGYYRLSLFYISKKRKFKAIHRLVAETFIDNKFKKEQVNHIDGNKLNNNISNLEWVTRQENMKHAVDTGLFDNKGQRHGNSKLKNIDIYLIRDLVNNYGLSHGFVGDILKTSRTNVLKISKKQAWSHI